ncbi:MAG: tetratricopeptide repeat protein [Acidobacteriota bacterium]|nr:tetratricopeptide repeat protein [Acidobacteriota bacterium]
MEKISQYCQKCRAANLVGERNCSKCGTRLMLVVFPPSLRHDEGIVPSYYEDHLLERVTLLELQLAQVAEKLGMAFEFFAREAKELKKDRKFIRAFSDAIKEINPELAAQLNQKKDEKSSQKIERIEVEDKQKQFLKLVLTQHDKPNAELFSHLLQEGIRLLKSGEEKQAFQMLERAALLSPENAPLLIFIGENFYRADKFSESKFYLEQAFELAPNDEKVLLLLGSIYADTGETDAARRLLSVLANNEKASVLVHFVWGMMAAFEENWTESLAAFKQAAGGSGAAELNYLIGCAYFQLRRYDAALRFFEKAVSLDAKYTDALFMQAIICKIQNDAKREEKILETIAEKKESGAQCLEFLSGRKPFEMKTALPFLHFTKDKKHLLTGGSLRLNKFFREQIYKSIQ